MQHPLYLVRGRYASMPTLAHVVVVIYLGVGGGGRRGIRLINVPPNLSIIPVYVCRHAHSLIMDMGPSV